MRKAPPRNGGDGGVLRPGKQQQQSENCLNIDGDEKQGIDVEIHRGSPIIVRQSISEIPLRAIAIRQSPEKIGE
jgi:hypothetical protein